jgi:hypothetical protein
MELDPPRASLSPVHEHGEAAPLASPLPLPLTPDATPQPLPTRAAVELGAGRARGDATGLEAAAGRKVRAVRGRPPLKVSVAAFAALVFARPKRCRKSINRHVHCHFRTHFRVLVFHWSQPKGEGFGFSVAA